MNNNIKKIFILFAVSFSQISFSETIESNAELVNIINDNCDYDSKSSELQFYGVNRCISTSLIPNQGDGDIILGFFNASMKKLGDLKKGFTQRSWFPSDDEQNRVLMSKLIYYSQAVKM